MKVFQQPPQQDINNVADELERFFAGIELPGEPIDISDDYTICEPDRYVKGAIRAIRSEKYDTNAFLERLQQLREKVLN